MLDWERRLPVKVTFKWPQHEHMDMAAAAARELRGVAQCHTFVAVMTDAEYAYRGTFTELGAALALGKRVAIVGSAKNKCATNCFWWHPDVRHFATMQEVEAAWFSAAAPAEKMSLKSIVAVK